MTRMSVRPFEIGGHRTRTKKATPNAASVNAPATIKTTTNLTTTKPMTTDFFIALTIALMPLVILVMILFPSRKGER